MAPKDNPERPFRWDDLDQRIYSYKRNEVANEMHKRISEAERRIGFETAQKHNIGAYWPELLAFHEKLAGEWAQKLYEAHCETWAIQGRTLTPDFIRAVRDRPIAQLVAARRSSVAAEMGNWHRRTGQSFNSGLASSWAMAMDRLAARWRAKLEAEAAAAEHRLSRNALPSSRPETKHDLPSPGSWEGLYQTFKTLGDEELAAAPGNRGDRWLRAYVDYRDATTKHGTWHLGGGISESFKARFVVLAINAGRDLRAKDESGNLLDIWLHHVFQNLFQNKSDLLFAPSETGGIITRLCEASALYCLRLQARVLEGSPTEGVARKAADKGSPLRRPGPLPLRPADFVNFAGKLWIDSKGLSAKVNDQLLAKIATSLDEKQFLPPTKYLERKCASDLKIFNSKNAHSKVGPITTWSRLVEIGDKDQLRAIRKLLSRCAGKTK